MTIWTKQIYILGAGDRGSAIAIRLFNSGFRPVLVEREHPTDLYYFRNFSDVVYQGEKKVEDITCTYIGNQFSQSDIKKIKLERKIPCITLSEVQEIANLKPDVVIDCAGCFPKKIVLEIQDFNCLIRVGNYFTTGVDGHYIIGDRGQFIGRILPAVHAQEKSGSLDATTINAPLEGLFFSDLEPGENVAERQKLGQIDDINILSPDHGLLTGRLHSGHYVSIHQPLFNLIRPRSIHDVDIRSIPPSSYSIAGGLLEAVLAFFNAEYQKKEREKIP